MESAVQIVINGDVQGVGYRYWTRQSASRLGLRGWVRNRSDGSVEVLAVGPAMDLDKLVDDCRLGPRAANVSDVTVSDIATPNRIVGFEISP